MLNLVEIYQLQRDYFASSALRNQKSVKEVVALYEKIKEVYEKERTELKEFRDQIESKIQSSIDSSLWSFRYQIKVLQWKLDFYEEREKRRSKNRREKRLRRKQRQAEANGLNRMVIEDNEAGEE